MDMVAACRAFVAVSERGSFTIGAAGIGIAQTAASRRIAALEDHLGVVLIDRRTRGAGLTMAGHHLLSSARRLVAAADVIEDQAAQAASRPVVLAVPATGTERALATLLLQAQAKSINLHARSGDPTDRSDALHQLIATAAILPAPADQADWSFPLGLAGSNDKMPARVFVESIRTTRGDRAPQRRIWITPEDDVPHVRDTLLRYRDAVGLKPTQILIAGTVAEALAATITTNDLILCTPAQATHLGLVWRPIGDLNLARTYRLAVDRSIDYSPLHTQLHDEIGEFLTGTRQ